MSKKRPELGIDKSQVDRNISYSEISEFLLSGIGIQLSFILMLIISIIYPIWMFIFIVYFLIAIILVYSKEPRLPLRLPKDANMNDPSTKRFETTIFKGFKFFFRFSYSRLVMKKASGILFMGYARGKQVGKELWLSYEDLVRHMIYLATTGGGKTRSLLGIMFNSLCWGRGFYYIDGKGQNDVVFAVYSLAKRFGREDDFLLKNYLTAGASRFDSIINKSSKRPPTNTTNLFLEAQETYIIQLMESLLPNAKDEGGWQEKAKAMIQALVMGLCYKCKRNNLVMSQDMISDYLPLKKIAELYIEAVNDNWHKEAKEPIENYLNTLAGFDIDLVHQPSTWVPEVFNQHGYLIQQFSRMLSLFNDMYGHIFSKDCGDIVIKDVLHNDRILMTLIPALELSANETAILGKLEISSFRMTLSQDLGQEVEGSAESQIIIDKYKNKFPYPIIMDESGSYLPADTDRMVSQLRSLEYFLMLSAQDLLLLLKNIGEYSLGSIIGNTNTKIAGKIEDTNNTLKLFQMAAGKERRAEATHLQRGIEFYDSYVETGTVQLNERDKIEQDELKSLKEGENLIVFEDQLIRGSWLYIEDEYLKSKQPLKLNRFIELKKPDIEDLYKYIPKKQLLHIPNIKKVNVMRMKIKELEKKQRDPDYTYLVIKDTLLFNLLEYIDMQETNGFNYFNLLKSVINDDKKVLKRHKSENIHPPKDLNLSASALEKQRELHQV